MMIDKLCKTHTNLSGADISCLEKVSENLQYTADLVNSDVFIDCMCKGGGKCVVVAHARPSYRFSAYESDVSGAYAERDKEPAVYNAFETGMPCRDLKAITQEGKTVKQDVIPVKNADGGVIAVLIAEEDITGQFSEKRKFYELAKTAEAYNLKRYGLSDGNGGSVTVREIHHRIKNNLQMVASLLNIQANRSESGEVQKILKENVGRVLSISAIHDILTNRETDGEVSIKQLIKKIIEYSRRYAIIEDASIEISLQGDDIILSADTATSIAVIVNELVSNAIIHGFEGKSGGSVVVSTRKGALGSSVTVCDNGRGFEVGEHLTKNVGLKLVQEIVADKLKGSFNISSDAGGTTATFDFQ